MYLVFDIGSTRMRVGVSGDLEKIDRYEIYDTPKEYNEAVALIEKFADGLSIKGVAGCVPGFIGKDGFIVRSGNLPTWIGQNIQGDIKNIFGVDPVIDNDAVLANLGEWGYGAGRGSDHLAYLTVSTGVGGSISYQGRALPKFTSFEPGQQCLVLDDGTRTLESLISGKSMVSELGVDAAGLRDESAWKQIQQYLALGISNLIYFWSPERLVIGGGVIEFGKIELDDLTELVMQRINKDRMPEIKLAELGAIGGLYGGLVLLKERR